MLVFDIVSLSPRLRPYYSPTNFGFLWRQSHSAQGVVLLILISWAGAGVGRECLAQYSFSAADQKGAASDEAGVPVAGEGFAFRCSWSVSFQVKLSARAVFASCSTLTINRWTRGQ